MKPFLPAIQTFSLRHLFRKNLNATLTSIASLRIKHLELAGTACLPPKVFAKACAQAGLEIIGIHESFFSETLLEEVLKEIRFRADVFQCRHVTTMWDPSVARTERTYAQFAVLCAKAASILDRDHITLSIHCYPDDLLPIEAANNVSFLDLIIGLQSLVPISIEVDTYFVFKSGVPLRLVLTKCANRCSLVHLNDIDTQNNQIYLGGGNISWLPTLEQISNALAPKFWILEHDVPHPLAALQRSLEFLKELNMLLSPDQGAK